MSNKTPPHKHRWNTANMMRMLRACATVTGATIEELTHREKGSPRLYIYRVLMTDCLLTLDVSVYAAARFIGCSHSTLLYRLSRAKDLRRDDDEYTALVSEVLRIYHHDSRKLTERA